MHDRLQEVIEAAEKAGWNGIENSKSLSTFIVDQGREVQELKLQLEKLQAVSRELDDCRKRLSRGLWKKTPRSFSQKVRLVEGFHDCPPEELEQFENGYSYKE